jgi:hypothetical protein
MSYTDLGAPQSRNEVLLMNMLGATYEVEEPQSRVEYLLKEILENGGTGGGDVTGVKGAIEAAFRKGNVNITIADIVNLADGLAYDAGTKTLKGTQYYAMPAPSADWLGKTIQYVGEDTDTYKSGHFYKCVQKSGTYQWEETLGDEALTTDQLNALLDLI